jgi:AcrR family transcriptional regulator
VRIDPTTDRGRASVERVLDAARVLFARQGVRATTLDQIGASAGVGRGQLYHFFAGKTDLVADVATSQVDRVLEALEPRLATLASAADLRAWCDETVAVHASSGSRIRCPVGALAQELGDDDPRARAALAAGFERWRALLEAGLHRVAERGELAPGADPATLATGLLAAYEGGVLLADVSGDVERLRQALHAVIGPALLPAATS